MIGQSEIDSLNTQFEGCTPQQILKYAIERWADRIALSSSLGLEDQVLTDMICGIDKKTRIFTLDTGRLFPETYSLIDRTNAHYGIRMEIFFPDNRLVEEMVCGSGVNLFYESVEKRKECCRVRKLEPLSRAFSGLEAWICGLRREQSVTRTGIRSFQWDENNGILKINPLSEWSHKQVKEYISTRSVPYNKLHDKGFPSIGCQPCTRAVEQGEDVRAGRWWWEDPEQKECGLHRR